LYIYLETFVVVLAMIELDERAQKKKKKITTKSIFANSHSHRKKKDGKQINTHTTARTHTHKHQQIESKQTSPECFLLKNSIIFLTTKTTKIDIRVESRERELYKTINRLLYREEEIISK
jgi:hypothetical protein